MKSIRLTVALFIGALLSTLNSHAADLTLSISNIKDLDGIIRIALYNSKESFQEQEIAVRSVTPAAETEEVVFTGLPVGNYAVLLFQDNNGNEDLDANMFGLPTEPWSASVGDKRLFGAPTWEDARFVLLETGTVVSMPLR